MPKPRKPHVSFTMKLEIGISQRLSDYCGQTGITKTAAIEKAITMYLDRCEEDRRLIEIGRKKSK